MRTMRASVALLVGLVAVLVGLVPAGPAAAVAGPDPARPERVVLVSVPTLTWDLVADEQPPALTGLLARSAVASTSVRTIGPETTPGEAYATIGAGNRVAVPEGSAGVAFGADVDVDGETAATVLARRSGEPVGDAAVVHLGMPAITTVNDRLLYGAEPGALGSALASAGLVGAVIGNADLEADLDLGVEPLQAHREAALAVVDGTGVVPEGAVGPELLLRDPEAPLGLRLDPDAVLDAFDRATADVVLVELSDLDRADAFRPLATRSAADAARRAALTATDVLLAGLLDRVDLARELVILVAPTAPRGPAQLSVAAMAGPGVEPGLLQSGTTGRAGYVTLPDLAPTVVASLGLDQPGAMNGAPMSDAGGSPPDAGTWRERAADNERALFRNRATGPLTVVFIVLVVLGLALAAVALSGPRPRPRLRRAAALVQLVTLAVPLVTYLAGLVREDRLGVPGSIVAVLAVATLAGVLARAVGTVTGRADRVTAAFLPPLLLLAATALVLLADVFVGAPLQIDTAFGYGGGAIVAGRFTGYGNLAGGLLTLSVIAAATGTWGLLQLRRRASGPPSSLAVAAIGAAFLFTVVVTGLPGLGRDVGGVLAIVPGFVIVLAVLTGIRLTWRRLAVVGVATVGALAVFGVVDLLRPPEQRGHLGRLIDQTAGDQGTSGLVTVIQRKVDANLTILGSSVWSLVIPVAFAFLAFLIWRPPRTMEALLRLPGVRALLVGSLATCGLAAVLNDSGIAIPGIMLTLLLPYVAHLALELPEGHPATGDVTGGAPGGGAPTGPAGDGQPGADEPGDREPGARERGRSADGPQVDPSGRPLASRP